MLRSVVLAALLGTACVSTPKAPAKLPPAERERIAFLDLRPSDEGSRELAQTLGELIAFDLEDTGRFKVLAKQDLARVVELKQQQQLMGCETEACQADLAKAADVGRLVTGSLGKLGNKYVLVLKLVDSTKVEVLRQAKDTVPGREEDLVGAVERTTLALATPEEPVRETRESTTSSAGDEARDGFFGSVFESGARAAVGGILGSARSTSIGAALEPVLTSALEAELTTSLKARVAALRAKREESPR